MKPRIVITVGDPAGIGPEIVAAAVRDPHVLARCEPVVVGDPVAFELHRRPLPKVEMLPAPGLSKQMPLGRPSREAGLSALESLRLAVGLIRARPAQALVTAPISQQALHLTGVEYPGHTEWLAHACRVDKVAMLMVAGRLPALLMTRHVPVSDISRHLTRQVVEDSAELAYRFVKDVLKKPRPRIAACGLNPHAGDGGLIGTAETKTFEPALHALQRRGILIKGPRPADTVFREMANGL